LNITPALIAEGAHCAGATEVAVIQGDFTPAAVPVPAGDLAVRPEVPGLLGLRQRR
jgi:hypothetical protein